MADVWMGLSRPMVLARLDAAKTVTRRLVTRASSLIGGNVPTAEEWAALDWSTKLKGLVGESCDAWSVLDGARKAHLVTPRIQPGDVIWWREQTEDRGCAVYSADRLPVSAQDGIPRVSWRKPDGRPYRASSLAPRYMPHAWCRLRDVVRSVTPSTPAAVSTLAEARAEGLVGSDACGYLWRGCDTSPGVWPTPHSAYSALLREIHGSEVPASAPCWRIDVTE